MAKTPATKAGQKKTSRSKTGRKKADANKADTKKTDTKKGTKRKTTSKTSVPKASIARRGLMLVLSSPSGAGKTTLSRMLLAADRSVELSVSVTTRAQRANEVDGRDYRFIDKPRFDRMIENGDLLEWAHVFGNFYGT